MNWNNILPILSILVPILLGLWAIMRNIKEEIRGGNATINSRIDCMKIDFDRRLDHLDHKIDAVKTELKEDIKILDRKIDAVKTELKEDIKILDRKIDVVKAELKEDIKILDRKIDMAKAEIKEDIQVVRSDMRSLQEMLWISVVGKKSEFYEPPRERQQG